MNLLPEQADPLEQRGVIEILLVEDEAADAALLQRAFTKSGLLNPLRLVRDGEEALDYLFGRGPYADREAHPLPGLVLLDLKLPKIDGLEVLRQLKAANILKRIPVIVLTSSEQSGDINSAYDLGVNSYLVKPVQFSAFCEIASNIQLYWLLLNRSAETEVKT